MKMSRRIWAVFAGLLFIWIITTITDIVLHLVGFYSPPGTPQADGPYVVASAYRIVYGIAGCWVTARLAPGRPMFHALVLGGIGLVLSVAGSVAMWEMGPAWYSIVVIAISLPCAWIGGRIRETQLRAPSFETLSQA
jgi:hypothetical protein